MWSIASCFWVMSAFSGGGVDVGVAEQRLHRGQVHTGLGQCRPERVPQGGRPASTDAAEATVVAEDCTQARRCQWVSYGGPLRHDEQRDKGPALHVPKWQVRSTPKSAESRSWQTTGCLPVPGLHLSFRFCWTPSTSSAFSRLVHLAGHCHVSHQTA